MFQATMISLEDITFEQIALAMPAVFVFLYLPMAVAAPRFRWAGIIVATAASVNILFADTFYYLMNYDGILAIFAAIDLTAAVVLIKVKNTAIKGRIFRTDGAKAQGIVLLLFVSVNLFALADINAREYLSMNPQNYMLKSVYIHVIFALNILQLLTMGSSIYGSYRSSHPRKSYRNSNVVHGFSMGYLGHVLRRLADAQYRKEVTK